GFFRATTSTRRVERRTRGDGEPVGRIVDELKFAKAYALNIRSRQKAQGFIPRDLGVLRRAQRAGRVHIGRGTYGVPGLHMTMLDDTKLFIGNYSSTGPLCYL